MLGGQQGEGSHKGAVMHSDGRQRKVATQPQYKAHPKAGKQRKAARLKQKVQQQLKGKLNIKEHNATEKEETVEEKRNTKSKTKEEEKQYGDCSKVRIPKKNSYKNKVL